MEGQASLKSHCSAAAAAGGFLAKSGGGGRRSFSSSSWFLRHPKKRISVERTPPLRSLIQPLMSLQDQETTTRTRSVEEGEGLINDESIIRTEMVMSGGKSRRSSSTTAHVKFVLHKACSFGERFFLVGDDPMFGLWDLENAIPLHWSQGHFWTAEMDLPLEKIKSAIQFKFILRDPSGEFHWQPGPDRVLQIWETSNTIVVTEDWDKAENQKITEQEEEQLTDRNIVQAAQLDATDQHVLDLVCGLTSIPIPIPIPVSDHQPIPNEEAAAAAAAEPVKAAENEKQPALDNIDLLFTSEIIKADEVNV